MAGELRPMDPERLKLARAMASYPVAPRGLVELLAHADYHERRADTAVRERDELSEQLDAHREAAANLRMPVDVAGNYYLIHSPGAPSGPSEGWHYVKRRHLARPAAWWPGLPDRVQP